MNIRHSIRLKGYDYSQNGNYFITIDSWQKRKIFGSIISGKMILNEYGKIFENEILNTHIIRQGVHIPVFQIMPDHFHMILEISVGAHGNAPVQNLGCIIRGVKMATTMKMKIMGYLYQVWQRNYYEEIIRNQGDFDRIRKYIIDNPEKIQ